MEAAIYAVDTPALVLGRRLSPVPIDVGLMFVVWRFGNLSAQRFDRSGYLRQSVASARAAKALNPKLGVALATNIRVPSEISIDIVVALRRKRDNGTQTSLWAHRLTALAASPFELTLAIDSSVTICSTGLHAALRAEHSRNRVDFAVGFEATPLPELGGRVRSRVPAKLEDVLPHNYAMLFRRGPGWAHLLHIWSQWTGRFGDDQYELRDTLRRLWRAGYEAGDAAKARVRVRVMRLLGALTAFKSLDKRRGLMHPRYTWPLAGEALLIHSYDSRVLQQPPRHSSICAALNQFAPAWRLIVQQDARAGYAVHRSTSQCVDSMLARQQVSPSSWRTVPAVRVCQLLNVSPREPQQQQHGHERAMVEPLSSFWLWLRKSGLAS